MQQQRYATPSLIRLCKSQLISLQRPYLQQQLRPQTNGANQQAAKAGTAGVNGQTPGSEEDSTPPSAFAAVATMGAGALGAVAVAAVGVWGVFKMAMAVAEGTGRTLRPQAAQGVVPAAAAEAPANDLLPMQPDVPAGPLYPPTPAHRKVDLQAQLQDLYQMPRSRAVEDQKAAIRRELQALQ